MWITLSHTNKSIFYKIYKNDGLTEYENGFNYLKLLRYNTQDRNVVLKSVWVNFQKKYEFNPLHDHTGIISFVIWIDVPYTKDLELLSSPGRNEKHKL